MKTAIILSSLIGVSIVVFVLSQFIKGVGKYYPEYMENDDEYLGEIPKSHLKEVEKLKEINKKYSDR